MSDRPCIPLVELVSHYREFKSRRDATGRLLPGRYRSQAARRELAEHYLANPSELLGKFERSVDAFAAYRNVGEAFVGPARPNPSKITRVDEISTGRKAAAYMAWALPERKLAIKGLGDYVYIDHEIQPARTTSGRHATMANRFCDGDPSTRAMSADLLLRSCPDGRPAVGEIKLSTAKGDDADAFYALIQALAVAAQLVGAHQRERLKRCYSSTGFSDSGSIDVLVFVFQLGQRPGRQTIRPKLKTLTTQLCTNLDQGTVPNLRRVALVDVLPRDPGLRFIRQPS